MLSAFILILSFFINPGSSHGQVEDSFKASLDNFMKKNFSRYESYEYNVLQLPVDYKQIEIIEDRDFDFNGSMVYIPVKIVNKNGRSIKSVITVKLKLFKNVLVSTKSIERNENFSLSDVVLKKMDITQIKGTALDSLQGIEAYRNRAFLKAGEPVIKENIELKPIINPGDLVEAKYTVGNVVVVLDAFSEQEGIPGGIIEIISKDKKRYKAKIIDSHNVTIIE
jgi:flagella basal body P-ring formation protein FlgA